MTTMPCPAAPLPLHRPWLLRVATDFVEALRGARRARRVPDESDLASLAVLGDATLRDIGAPDWVRERARGAADPWSLTAGERRTWWIV